MHASYRTAACDLRHEIDKVKGSRFIASLAPIQDVQGAEAFVAARRIEFKNATHNCFAYRSGAQGEKDRFHDDGEPSGSAGRPILQQIEGHGLTNLVLVVTRYFGGTKLGVGGLMRAYGGVARAVLERAAVREVILTRRLVLEHPYECSGAVQGLLASEGLEPSAADYGAMVRIELEVPEARAAAFLSEFGERTAGRGRMLED